MSLGTKKKRVVLSLPAPVGYISFEKDRLDAKAADLMVELISLDFLELKPK